MALPRWDRPLPETKETIMSEPRVPLLPIEEARQAAAKVDIAEQIAELSIFRILLRHPKLAKSVNDVSGANAV